MFRNNNKECKNLSEDQIIILFQKTVEIGNTLAPLRVIIYHLIEGWWG